MRGQYLKLMTSNVDLFGKKLIGEDYTFQKERIESRIEFFEQKVNDIKNNVFYENAFEWRFEFPEVLNDNGDFIGFDMVIGNPPYGVKFENNEKDYFKNVYQEIHVRTTESYNYFIKQFSIISAKNALCCLIVPSSFLNQTEFEKTRKIILSDYSPFLILNLGDGVFEDVATPTCIIGFDIQNKYKATKYEDLSVVDRRLLPDKIKLLNNNIEIEKLLTNQSSSFIYRPYTSILIKCYNNIPTLKDVAEEVATGVSSGLDKSYVFLPNEVIKKKFENYLLKQLVVGGEIHRFYINPISGKKLIYITDKNNIEDFPNIEREILIHKEQLIKRREAANGKIKWYSLNWPRRKKLFEEPKILIRQTANRIMAAYDEEKWYCLKSGIIIQLPGETNISYKYLLGLLNSLLMDFLYNDLVNEDNRIFPEVKPIQLFKLPIKIAPEQIQKSISLIVDKIVEAKKDGDTSLDLENQIDQLVYKLYELTEEEIKIIEGV